MKILLYTDLAIRPDQLFWHRDLGLLTQAFRDLGHDAYLAVHLATDPSTTPAVPNERDHPREQPFEVPQLQDEVGPPRPAPDSFSHPEIRNSKSETNSKGVKAGRGKGQGAIPFADFPFL